MEGRSAQRRGFAAMVRNIDQLRLGIVKDGVRILSSRSFSEELAVGEIENANRVTPSVDAECEIQFRHERDTTKVRKLADGADTAAGARVDQPDEIVAGECDVKRLALERHVADAGAREPE